MHQGSLRFATWNESKLRETKKGRLRQSGRMPRVFASRAKGNKLWHRALRGLTRLRHRLAREQISHKGKTVGQRRIHSAAMVEPGVTAPRHAAPGCASVAHQGTLHRRRHIAIRLPGSDKKRLLKSQRWVRNQRQQGLHDRRDCLGEADIATDLAFLDGILHCAQTGTVPMSYTARPLSVR